MSMINDMLRDLEQRKASERGEFNTSASENSLIEAKPNPIKKYLILLIVLMLVAVFGVMVLLFRHNEMTKTPNLHKANPAQEGALKVDEEQVLVSKKTDSLTSAKIKKAEVAEVKTKNISTHVTTNIAPPSVKQLPLEAPLNEAKISESGASIAKPTKSAQTKVTVESLSDKPKLTEHKVAKIIKKQAAKTKEQAETTAHSTVELAPTVSVSSNKALVRRKPTISPQKRDQNMAEAARKAYEAGEARQAYRLLYDFIAKNKVDQESRIVLITYLLQEERVAEAGDVLVTTQVDQSPELRQLKARWYVAKEEPNLALYTLRESLPTLESYPEYYALLAAYYQRFGFAAKAAETYGRLLEYDNESANWWAGLAIALDSSQQYKEAVNAYQQALETPNLSPELIEYIENRLSLLTDAENR